MRLPALIAALFLLCAASPPEIPPVPEILKPYVKDGRLDPGDYGWMRGHFSDASPTERDSFLELMRWQEQCLKDGHVAARATLQSMGIADPKIDPSAGAPLLCRMVMFRPFVMDRAMTFAQFQEIRDRALPMADMWLTATRLATSIGGPRGPALSDALIARPLGEQMLRLTFGWGHGDLKDAPKLAPQDLTMFQSRIGMAMVALDHDNSAWLKKTVAERGWPKISEVGERASAEAWLLAQHADADPVFQLQVLRLMEPLMAKGEVSKSNYAYLHDRIMLKLVGKQRYATQMTCEKGKRVPQPLEDEQAVDRLRAEMGMPTLAENLKRLDDGVGPCPPG